ncbi:Uncharacterised protein [Mycobacterium tuberculosis]|uniref:Uncharacterized protein n=1 Tax=Mycobacterium tuberculosis TaxID=1773 RepID=A0A916PC68_MYCTX|nr:Uncharacterised protein [Mycobacterium tuberculosis]COY58927.1 Uncharacterised protein [Mycobacterium tuberculosis]
MPLEVRGIVPADTSRTSRTVTPCPTAMAARMSSTMGWWSSLCVPAARSPTITSCSEVSSGSNFSPACESSNTV